MPYANGAITLPAAFVNAITDGAPVKLTTYHVTKSGSTVTGSTS